jgi:Zn-dependent peptidase ImmA (M78 family)
MQRQGKGGSDVASGITISRDMLLWAISRGEQDAGSLLEKVPRIREWLSGDRKPTMSQLKDLAQRTHTPLGFFFLPEPPSIDVLPIPYFRTVEDASPVLPSINLLDTVRQMQLRQDWMRDFLIAEGNQPLPFVGRAHRGMPIEEVVAIVRDALDLESNWAAHEPSWEDALDKLFGAVERSGILVMVSGMVGHNANRLLDPDEFRGFTLIDDYSPLIFVNRRDARAAQMFTVAHELAHVALSENAVFDLRGLQVADDPVEKFCNLVAAEFLVPAKEMRENWEGKQLIPSLARRFKVSEIVVARRALDLDLMSRGQFFAFYHEYESREWVSRSKSGGGNFHWNARYRLGLPFSRAIIQSVREGTTLYSEAYRLTGLKRETFEKYTEFIAKLSKE